LLFVNQESLQISQGGAFLLGMGFKHGGEFHAATDLKGHFKARDAV
jgi:hypothetical protein